MNAAALANDLREIDRAVRSAVPASSSRRSLRDHLISGDAILEIKPRRALIGELLELDSLAATYGAPGAGKSLLTLDVALSVASSRPWQGRSVVDGPVLYVAAEDPQGIAQRARAWRSRNGNFGAIHWLTGCVPLLDRFALHDLCEIVAELAPAYVVIDTLARCTVGADENSGRDMGAVVDALDQIRTVIGSCVNVVHHSGKDLTRGMRGHTALLAGLDTAIACTRTRSGITAVVEKQKNAADGQRLHFSLEPEGDSVVIVESATHNDTADRFRPTVLMERVSRHLEGIDHANTRSLRSAGLGKSDYVDLAIACLIDEGFVTVTTAGKEHQHRSTRPFRETDGEAS